MEVDQYLKRMGLADTKGVTLETLHELQLQHMLHIPFENLNVIHHVPIPLDI